MTTRYCQECGTPAEAAAVFCAGCGATLAVSPGVSTPDTSFRGARHQAQGSSAVPAARAPSPPAPAPGRPGLRRARLLSVAIIAAVATLVGGAVVLDLFGGHGPADQPAASPVAAASAAPTGASSAASPGAPTAVPTAAPTTSPPASIRPDASTPLVAAESPIGAVQAFLAARGLRFAGTCAAADPAADPGSYCDSIVDDRGAIQVHWVGLAGSEPETWLLVADGQYGWAVIEWVAVEDPNAGPPF